MQALTFDEGIENVLKKDPRYARDAYHFLREALEHTQKHTPRKLKDEEHHVSGQELLEGIREHALTSFGPMATTVFEHWGIHRCEDFGELVFNLVEGSLLKKTDKDSREDFKCGYDFFTAFRKPFLPKRRSLLPAPPAPAQPPEPKSKALLP